MLKPYPKYKETPALWLNSIPNHWESHKIRELFVPLLMGDICIIYSKAIILSKSFTEMAAELLLTCGQPDIQK